MHRAPDLFGIHHHAVVARFKPGAPIAVALAFVADRLDVRDEADGPQVVDFQLRPKPLEE